MSYIYVEAYPYYSLYLRPQTLDLRPYTFYTFTLIPLTFNLKLSVRP